MASMVASGNQDGPSVVLQGVDRSVQHVSSSGRLLASQTCVRVATRPNPAELTPEHEERGAAGTRRIPTGLEVNDRIEPRELRVRCCVGSRLLPSARQSHELGFYPH